jgi:hypothetical protein
VLIRPYWMGLVGEISKRRGPNFLLHSYQLIKLFYEVVYN